MSSPNKELEISTILKKAKEAIERHGEKLTVKNGTKIITEGDQLDHLYYVHSGECKTYGVGSVFPLMLGVIEPGHTFGESSFLLGGRKATATVMAVKKSEILRISYDKIIELIESNNPDATSITYFLAHIQAFRIKRLDLNFFKPGLLEQFQPKD